MLLLVLTDKKEFKLITLANFKKLEINFTGWYCPINNYTFMIEMDGSIRSGVCGENVHTTVLNPWWDLEELTLTLNNICSLKRGSCFCGADIKAPKAIDEETHKWFRNNKPKLEYKKENLQIATTDDNVIAVTDSWQEDCEVHFHIGKLCNFDCSYCASTVHNNFSPHTSLETFKLALNLINPHVSSTKRKLYLTGGEPTLNPQLAKMIQIGKELNYRVRINTNGTASLTRLTNLLQLGAYLNITFHEEFSNEKLMNKIGKLASIPNVKILVKIPLHSWLIK